MDRRTAAALDTERLQSENRDMFPRTTLLLALLVLGLGCSATWEGMPRDSDALFRDDGRTESVVAEAQRVLNDRGYDVGAVDGLIGPRTTTAILSYQADHGLHRTGYVDDELIASMRGEAPKRRAQTAPAKEGD